MRGAPILKLALDTPLRRLFDYRLPAELATLALEPGMRLRVPFGRRRLVGVLIERTAASELPAAKLKCVEAILDPEPLFDAATFETLLWAAQYYHHPIGEVFAAALPKALREGQSASTDLELWQVSELGERELAQPSDRRAPKQRAALAWLRTAGPAEAAAISAAHGSAALRALAQRGWVHSISTIAAAPTLELQPSPVELSAAQAAAVTAIEASLGAFRAHLLYGITGSGKTEVYLRAIASAVMAGRQALVLVPEIALTPQLLARFTARFGVAVVALHSGLVGSERRDAWRAARSGAARIVIGTRSAVFTPLPQLGLVIVDEEHDASYKQHEGFRYSARDLAVLRAQRARVPVVLGSATPSLETLDNARQGRYGELHLPERAAAAQPPRLRLIDLRAHATDHGLAQPAVAALREHLAAGGQAIVYLNRRGFAPALYCNHCGWIAPCAHCDARLTWHRRAAELRCHHCGAHSAVPAACAACAQPLLPVGQGTEQVEERLAQLFPEAPIARLDRDATAERGGLQQILARVHSREARILVGTQMLTKGHDFPHVSLVLILDADQGLFATDYRATERLAQSIVQVAGRAGRAERAGEVLIQTQFPEHALLQRLLNEGYGGFAAAALTERAQAHWPPYTRLALLRADAPDAAAVGQFLQRAAQLARPLAGERIKVLGPAPALMARRADRHRAQLLIETETRADLQRFLSSWLERLDALALRKGLRWSLDVDPIEVD